MCVWATSCSVSSGISFSHSFASYLGGVLDGILEGVGEDVVVPWRWGRGNRHGVGVGAGVDELRGGVGWWSLVLVPGVRVGGTGDGAGGQALLKYRIETYKWDGRRWMSREVVDGAPWVSDREPRGGVGAKDGVLARFTNLNSVLGDTR